jgi:hypothetical protein
VAPRPEVVEEEAASRPADRAAAMRRWALRKVARRARRQQRAADRPR